MYNTKKTTTEYKRWHREEDGTMVPDVTDYEKLKAWIDNLDPKIKQKYENIQEILKMAKAKAIPHYIVLKWNKKHPMIDPMYPIKKEWEIIKEYDDTFLWDSVLYQAWFFDSKPEAKQFVKQQKLQEV